MLLEFLRYLRAHDHEALVFAPGSGPAEFEGSQIVRVLGISFPLYPDLTLSAFCRRMGGILVGWRPDVLHLASPFLLGAYGSRVGRHVGVPMAAHYQTDIAGYSRHFHLGVLSPVATWHIARLHNRCQLNYAPTETQRQALLSHGVHQVRVLGRGVDSKLFSPLRHSQAVRQSLLRDGEDCIFLYVGRISGEKNLETLGPMIASVPRARLILVGDGPKRAALEKRFAGLPVTFLGTRHGEELATLYASADVFAFPSLTETFGQVVQEALASGLAVLANRSGGVQDLFHHAEEGYLCVPGSQEEWNATARVLASNQELRQRLGARGRTAVLSRTWDGIFASLLQDYAALALARTQMQVQ
jgi:glycosyltransferase involved in cell wall biosynthesis